MPLERRLVLDLPRQDRAVDVTAVLEAYVERVARLVLHASALAERMERRGGEHPVAERLSALREAVTRGERAIASAVRHHVGPPPRERRSGQDRRVATRA